MSLEQERVSVGTSATKLSTTTTPGASMLVQPHTVVVQNPSASTTVYIGTSAVTTAAYGHALGGGETIAVDLDTDEALYGCVASSTLTVNVLRTGI